MKFPKKKNSRSCDSMKYKAKIPLIVLLINVLFISGCSSFLKSSPPIKIYSAGKSVEGRAVKYVKYGTEPNTILLIAAIHGDEQTPISLINHFQNYLKCNKQLYTDKTIIIIPAANPDGIKKQIRYNSNNVDLNRNFPADNRKNDKHSGSFALSEPESYYLYKIINTYKPVQIISFHQSLGCIDYDGPAKELAERMAGKCKLPIHKVGAQHGSLGSYAGITLSIPIVTVEFTEEDSKKSPQQLWNDYKDMLIAAIDY